MNAGRRLLVAQSGFTLVELVMVIAIMGVVGSMVAVFMRNPIEAYLASGRRAGLTDTADTTLRRMSRDLRVALPNSIRTPTTQCIEFIPTKTGGRYRTEELILGDKTSLNFTTVDNTFNMLGSNDVLPAEQQIVAGDIIVVYNLGIAGADAYANNNTAVVSGAPSVAGASPETSIPIADTLFPLASGSNRFHVVPAGEQVVGYACPGDGTLRRYVRTLPYAVPAACPTAAALALAGTPILAGSVSACSFAAAGVNLQRNGLVSLRLQVTDTGETVSLYNEVHVSSTP